LVQPNYIRSTSPHLLNAAFCHVTGKGKSIWDIHANTPGRVNNNDNGNIACDSYHKYLDDVKLLEDLGVGFTLDGFLNMITCFL